MSLNSEEGRLDPSLPRKTRVRVDVDIFKEEIMKLSYFSVP